MLKPYYTPEQLIKIFIEAVSQFRQVFAKDFENITKEIDIYAFLFALAKQESNFNPEIESEDTFKTKGLFHILPSRRLEIIKTYQKNPVLVQKLYKSSFENQTAETFLCLVNMKNNYIRVKKTGFTNKEYLKFLDLIPENLKMGYVLLILHNQPNANTTPARQFYPPITHTLTAFTVYQEVVLSRAKDYKIESVAVLVPPAIEFLKWLFLIAPMVIATRRIQNGNPVLLPYAELVKKEYTKIQAEQKVLTKDSKLTVKDLINTLMSYVKPIINAIPVSKPVEIPEEKTDPIVKPEEKTDPKPDPKPEKEKEKDKGAERFIIPTALGLGLKNILEKWGLVLAGIYIVANSRKGK